ncbi:MAG: hypothetical protein GF365_03825 [Candidatus Buchananbacteria bacterium]|nr:hypothetical protein [Candidatus Buchananbacteria bacterium]
MNEFDKSIEENIKNAKIFSFEHKIIALQQLILQRYNSLITLSSISFALSGLIISIKGELISNYILALHSLFIFILVAIISFSRYLYLIRIDIKGIYNRIKQLPDENWNKPLKENKFKADWWPEILFVLFVVGLFLFGLSFL